MIDILSGRVTNMQGICEMSGIGATKEPGAAIRQLLNRYPSFLYSSGHILFIRLNGSIAIQTSPRQFFLYNYVVILFAYVRIS